MSAKKEALVQVGKLMGSNFLRFLFNIGYVMVFQLLFGPQNVLAAVALCVGLIMIPFADYHIRPLPMAGIIFGFYMGSGLVAQLALASPWVALPVNIAFVAALFLLISEPLGMKPFISFILCFVFCQATPVPMERFPMRMLGMAVGAGLVAATTLVVWRRRGYGREAPPLGEQIRLCARNRGLIARMALGFGIAMFIGMALGLKKPLWISIVVMSLTQLEFQETLQRIKHRSIATVIGILFFVVVFRVLVPERYAYAMILLMGYLSFFTPAYKHKQIVNAVCAINAALVLLDTTTAIENRALCLLAGIAIVLALCAGEALFRRVRARMTAPAQQSDPDMGAA